MFGWFRRRETQVELRPGSIEAMACRYLVAVMDFRPSVYVGRMRRNPATAGYVLGVLDAHAQLRGHGFIDDPSQIAPYIASYVHLFGREEGMKLFLDAVTLSKNSEPRFAAGMIIGGEDVHKLLEEGGGHVPRFTRTFDV